MFTFLKCRATRMCTSCWNDPCREHTDVSCAHRYCLLLALLWQILDAVDEELVGADVDSAGFYHPTAELHQLVFQETEIILLVKCNNKAFYLQSFSDTAINIMPDNNRYYKESNRAWKHLEFWIILTTGPESQLFKGICLLLKWKVEQFKLPVLKDANE